MIATLGAGIPFSPFRPRPANSDTSLFDSMMEGSTLTKTIQADPPVQQSDVLIAPAAVSNIRSSDQSVTDPVTAIQASSQAALNDAIQAAGAVSTGTTLVPSTGSSSGFTAWLSEKTLWTPYTNEEVLGVGALGLLALGLVFGKKKGRR